MGLNNEAILRMDWKEITIWLGMAFAFGGMWVVMHGVPKL